VGTQLHERAANDDPFVENAPCDRARRDAAGRFARGGGRNFVAISP